MIPGLRQLAILLAAMFLAASLAGCGTINEKMSATMGDYIPQWAGGLPPDAPPRPGTAKYDAFMKERERERLEPAADRPQASQPGQQAPSGQPAQPTQLNPVH